VKCSAFRFNHSIMAVMTSMVGWAAWSAFTRYIQLGLCHKSFNSPGAWRGTAIFITTGAAFGYWMDGVEERQRETVQMLRNKLVESRELRAQQQAVTEAKALAVLSELEEKTRQAAK